MDYCQSLEKEVVEAFQPIENSPGEALKYVGLNLQLVLGEVQRQSSDKTSVMLTQTQKKVILANLVIAQLLLFQMLFESRQAHRPTEARRA
jgi:hypothetical protein